MTAKSGLDLDGFGYQVIKAFAGVLDHFFTMAGSMGAAHIKERFGPNGAPNDQIARFPVQAYALVIIKAMKMLLELHLDQLPYDLKLEVDEDADRLLTKAMERGAEPLAHADYWKGYLSVKAMLDSYDPKSGEFKTGKFVPQDKDKP